MCKISSSTCRLQATLHLHISTKAKKGGCFPVFGQFTLSSQWYAVAHHKVQMLSDHWVSLDLTGWSFKINTKVRNIIWPTAYTTCWIQGKSWNVCFVLIMNSWCFLLLIFKSNTSWLPLSVNCWNGAPLCTCGWEASGNVQGLIRLWDAS